MCVLLQVNVTVVPADTDIVCGSIGIFQSTMKGVYASTMLTFRKVWPTPTPEMPAAPVA